MEKFNFKVSVVTEDLDGLKIKIEAYNPELQNIEAENLDEAKAKIIPEFINNDSEISGIGRIFLLSSLIGEEMLGICCSRIRIEETDSVCEKMKIKITVIIREESDFIGFKEDSGLEKYKDFVTSEILPKIKEQGLEIEFKSIEKTDDSITFDVLWEDVSMEVIMEIDHE